VLRAKPAWVDDSWLRGQSLQALENSGLTPYGSTIALGLVVVWATLLIPLCLNRGSRHGRFPLHP
jgi:hypothetical protein